MTSKNKKKKNMVTFETKHLQTFVNTGEAYETYTI